MSRWLARNGLKLTARGERLAVAAAGLFILGMAGTGFWIESIINTNIGVI